jgi:YhgE/Pip-like protein
MSSESAAKTGRGGASRRAFPVRARHLLKVRAVWILPLMLGSVVVVLITALYVGSVVDPLAHLHGLPVEVVNQDRGAMIGAQRINIGQEVQRGLSDSTAVSGRLALADTTLGSAEQAMDRGASYATVVIPPGFTASLLNLVGVSASGPGSGMPQIVILTNERAGTVGASLATGVLQPGLVAASRQIGQQLTAFVAPRTPSPLTRAFLADPATVTTAEYRPLPMQALPGVLRPLAEIEPLRQILAGTRAILYFDAQADAGLTRAVTAAALGLVFWLILGAVAVRWYDRKGFNRMDPELLAYVGGTVQQYKSRNADARQQDSGNAARQTEPNADVRQQDSGNAGRQTEQGAQV